MTTKSKWRTYGIRYFLKREGYSPSNALQTGGFSWMDSRSGSGLRNYKQLILNHSNATTAMTASSRHVEFAYGATARVRSKVPEYPYYWTHSVTGQMNYPLSFAPATLVGYTSVDNRAKAKFYSEINKARSAFSGGEFLGEIRETIGLIRRPFKAIRDHLGGYLSALTRAARQKRRGPNFRTWRQADKLKLVGSTWLEWRFGIRPLIKDVNDLLAELGNQLGEDRFVPVVAWEHEESTYSMEVTPTLVNNVIRFNLTSRKTGSAFVRYKGELKISGGSLGLKGVLASSARLERFVPTLWEICPFSWLVDYVINVNEVLESLTINLEGLSWYVRTIRRRMTHNVDGSLDVPLIKAYLGNSFEYAVGGPGSMRVVDSHLIRDVPYLGMVGFEFSLPTYPIKLANIGALVAQSRQLSELLTRR